jgi:hypothetical protein
VQRTSHRSGRGKEERTCAGRKTSCVSECHSAAPPYAFRLDVELAKRSTDAQRCRTRGAKSILSMYASADGPCNDSDRGHKPNTVALPAWVIQLGVMIGLRCPHHADGGWLSWAMRRIGNTSGCAARTGPAGDTREVPSPRANGPAVSDKNASTQAPCGPTRRQPAQARVDGDLHGPPFAAIP